ncbi:MAG: hypothetical protein V3U75_11810 [Methylococcaceae bacterium]
MNNALISNKTDNNFELGAMGFKLLITLMVLMYLTIPLAYADSNKHDIGNFFGFGKTVIEVDIVENPRKFSFDETPVFEDGSPAYGGEFITQGFIYPKGTLEMGDGVDAEGNPQFPDLVMGTWFCRGWHVGNGARTETGPVVVTHQIFNFGEKFGAKTITTDGLELADIGEPIKRAITGGTGRFKRAKGEQVQILEGLNQFETEQGALIGVKLQVKLKVYR